MRKLACKYNGGVEVPNSASWLWSAVRVVLVAEARSRVSLKSAAYAALVSAGGAGARNCALEVSAKGLM